MAAFRIFLTRNLILLFLSLCVISCCTTNNIHDSQKSINIQEESMLEKAKLSAVKITVAMNIGIKQKVSTSTVVEAEESDVYSGSGVILKHVENGSLILTAGHVCDHVSPLVILFHFPYYKEKEHDITTSFLFVVTDVDAKPHPAVMVALDKVSDVCILLTTPINNPAITLSNDEPRPSERVYSISYPRGLWQKGFNPILQGFFIGNLSAKTSETPTFSLRSAPGCSGGMIIDIDGQLVGMIHSVFMDFDSLTMGASLAQIKNVLEMAEFMYSIGRENYQMSLAREFVSFQKALVNIKQE